MNRMPLQNRKRRNIVSNMLGWDAVSNSLEQRIVPAYVSGDFGWASSLQTTKVDFENIVRSSAINSFGDIYQVGSFTGTVDFDAGTGISTVTAAGGEDAFVIKLDYSGHLVWVKTFNGLSSEKATSITLDANENLLVTGWYQGTVDFDPNSGARNLSSKGAEDAFIAKLDASGNLIWANSVGGISSDIGRTITTDNSGNIIIGGYFYNTVDFDPSSNVNNLTTNSGSNDIFVLKLDPTGKFIWVKGFIGITNSTKNIYDIRTDGNNNVVIAGSFYGIIDLDPNSGVFKATSVGSQDGFLVKLNSSGNFQWSQQIGSIAGEWVEGIAFDSQNNLYVCGGFQGMVDFDPSNNQLNKDTNGIQDAYLEKLSVNGELLWVNTWGSTEKDYAKYLYLDSNNHLKVTGGFSGTVDFDTGDNTNMLSSTGDADIYVSVFDTNGSFFGVKAIGQPNVGDESYGMALTPSGQPVLAGKYCGTTDFDPEDPVKSLPVEGGTNYFLTQWNRLFTKTTVSLSDSPTNGNRILTAIILNEDNTETTGSVVFTDTFNGVTTNLGSATVVNGIATLTLTTVTGGSHSYTASYTGDFKNFTSKSNSVLKSVANSSTSITSSSPTSIYGQSVTFTARVTSGSGQPTGTVNFYDGTNLIGSIAVTSSGDAIFSSSSLSLGAHTITAKYQGDVNFGSSNSSNLVQTVKIGSPAFLSIINGDAQSTIVATAFSNLLQVLVTDAYSNPISNSPVTFSINSNKASGSFASSSTVNTNVNGYALAPKLTANTVAGTFTVTASLTGLQNVVFNLTNLPGAASKVVTVSGSNQSTTVNTAFAAPLVAKVTDSYSNPISGVQVTFNAPGDGAFALLSGPTTVTSNSDGFVTSPSLSSNTVSGSYNVIASAQNLTSAQFLLTNKSGQASSIAKQSGNNQATTVNTSFANPISVKVSDPFGNPVTGVNVVFSSPSTGAGILFTGTSTVTTNAQGIATSTGIKANTIVGIYNVQAYVNDQLNTTFNLTNLAGAASKLVLMGGNNQSAVVNTAYAAPIQLLVTDSFGNAVSNSPITFTAPSSGAGIVVTGSNQAVSGTDGMASWSAFIANKIAGSFNVTA